MNKNQKPIKTSTEKRSHVLTKNPVCFPNPDLESSGLAWYPTANVDAVVCRRQSPVLFFLWWPPHKLGGWTARNHVIKTNDKFTSCNFGITSCVISSLFEH